MRSAPAFLITSLVLLCAAPHARAEGPSAAALVETVRYDPDSPTAPRALDRLASLGKDGFKGLATIAVEHQGDGSGLARRAVDLLLAGPRKARLEQAARAYDRLDDEDLKDRLALGLAGIYPQGAERLHEHLREGGARSLDLLRLLAARGLPPEEIEAARAHEALAGLATALLEGRAPPPRTTDLLPTAREQALLGLEPAKTALFLATFKRNPDVPLLSALAEVLREDDADRRLGAHCLLLSLSGLDQGVDADLWHSWIDGREGVYTPPESGSPGAIRAAIERGARFLRRDLTPDGAAHHRHKYNGDSLVGATALSVLALLATGASPDDPAVKRAIETTLLVYDRGGQPGLRPFSNRWETYGLALLAMALERMGATEHRGALAAVRDRLMQGLLENGQWTYRAHVGAEVRPTEGDNSNTQFANLGLRALRAADVELPEAVWPAVERHWRTTQAPDGSWGYKVSGQDRGRSLLAMTASGIAGLAIALEGRHGATASMRIREDPAVRKGLTWLGRTLFLSDFHQMIPYTLYAIERACVLTATNSFQGAGKTLDWYREGAWRLIATQGADGSWGTQSPRSWERQGFGKAPDTALALLFLCRATATVRPSAGAQDVAVVVAPEEVAIAPPGRRPTPAPETEDVTRWQRPDAAAEEALALTLDRKAVSTRTGKASIVGRVKGPYTHVEVGGQGVQIDEEGFFEARVMVEASAPIEVVARGEAQSEDKQVVHVTIDRAPPSITLVGPPGRPVGKQRLLVEANEVLDAVKVGKYWFPAEGRQAVVTTELGEHTRQVVVQAFDLAGNKTRTSFPVKVVDRVLVLDGGSAIRVLPREKADHYTIECWVKSPGVPTHSAVLSDTERSGRGIFLSKGEGGYPEVLHHARSGWVVVQGNKPLKVDRWTHVAATFDGSHVRLWIGGKLAGEAEADGYRKSGKAVLVGAEPDKHNRISKPFAGSLDEVRISSSARYAKPFAPPASHGADRHTTALFHFDTDTPEAVLDASGRQHNGVPLGKPRIEVR